MRPLFAFALVAALAPAVARGDAFEDRARGAVRVAPAELVWVLTASCDRADAVQRRQCELLRDRRAELLRSRPLALVADPAAFQVGAWDKAKRSASVRLEACVRCRGVEVEGRTWYVLGAGPARLEGGALRARLLHDTARVFPDEAAATAWQQRLGNVRVELIAKLPKRPRTRVAGKDAIRVDVIAWRVVTPCDGAVVIADPASGPAVADPRACPAPPPPPRSGARPKS